MASEELLDELRGSIRALENGSKPAGRREKPQRPANPTEPAYEKRKKKRTALDAVIALVNVSDRSERTIRERLQREGFNETEIEEAVDRSKEYGFIDDARFAEVLIRSRISQGKGSAGIIRELETQDIDIECVNGWPYEFPVSYDEELDRALALLEKKPPHAKNARDAAYRKLVGKGYPSSVASSAARMWDEGKQRE